MKIFFFILFISKIICKLVINSQCKIWDDGDNNGKFLSPIKIGSKLGEGKYGAVFECSSKEFPDCKYAMKVVVSSKKGINDIKNEASVLSHLRNNRWGPKYYDHFVRKVNGKTTGYLFMELVGGSTLGSLSLDVSFNFKVIWFRMINQ